MKVAIVSRGLVRDPFDKSITNFNPNAVNWCKENLDMLKYMLKDHEVTTFFCSWNVPNAIEYSKLFDNSLILKQPTEEECWAQLPHQPVWFAQESNPLYKSTALAKFFIQSKAIIKVVKSWDSGFDYIIFTRPDLKIAIEDINLWMTDKYSVPGMSYVNFNDHINIAKSNMMYKVWDISNEKLDGIIQRSLDTEDVVKHMVEDQSFEHESHLNITQFMVRGFDVVANYHAGGYEALKKQLGVK